MRIVIILALVVFLILACKKPQEEIEEIDPYIYKSGKLEEGETLANALLDEGIENALVYKLVNKLDSLYDLRRAHPNDLYMIKQDTLDIIQELSFQPDQIHNYRVIRDTSDTYFTQIDTLRLVEEICISEGEIGTSLWQGMSSENIDAATIVKFTQIFQWDIDFFIDPQKGDKFHIVYEKKLDSNGNFIKSGLLTGAGSTIPHTPRIHRYSRLRPRVRQCYRPPRGKLPIRQ